MSLGLLRQRCTTQRSVKTNVDGIIKNAWADIATDVECLIQEGAGRLGGGGNKPGAEGTGLEYDATCFLPPDSDLRPRRQQDEPDRLIQTEPATGTVFSVLLVVDKSGMGHHDTAYLRRMPQ